MCWRKALKQRSFPHNRGFTTIELVVTVGIMATVAAISIPIMNSLSPSYNSKVAARDIVSQMQLVRVHAIKDRVTTVVVFYPEDYIPADQANSYLIYEDNDGDWVLDPGEKVLVSRTYMPAKVDLQSATFTSNGSGEPTQTTSFGFDSQGIAARTGAVYVTGDLVLRNHNSQTRTINFNASGKIKISKL